MIKVVAADDHALFRQGLSSLFHGMKDVELCAIGSNGAEFLEMVDEHEPQLVIVDHDMPGLSGLDVVTQLQSKSTECRIIVLTGLADEQLLYDYDELGVEGILLKQEDPDVLVGAIMKIIKGETYRSEQVGVLIEKIEKLGQLTNRERQVIRHIAEGLSTKEISQVMGVSAKTIDNHRTNLMQKLDLHNAAEVVAFAVKTGLA